MKHINQHIAAFFINRPNVANDFFRTVEGSRSSHLNGGKRAIIEIGFNAGQRANQALIADRKAHAPALIDAFDAVFRTKTWPEWKEIFTENRFTFGEIGTVNEIADDVQMRESGAIISHPEPEKAGAALTVSSPFWLTDVEKRPPAMSPALGEHNDDVLAELGFSEADTQALRDGGAFG